jgi:hypothetical protein
MNACGSMKLLEHFRSSSNAVRKCWGHMAEVSGGI